MKNVTHLLPTGEIKEAAPLPQWKTPYNHDTNLVSDLTALYCADESKTKQEFVEEQDINKIMERLLRGAQQAEVALPEHFTDMTGKLDYFTMQNKIAQANSLFYLLPASIRSEHLNDPSRWADQVVAATLAGDGDKLEKLGIDLTAERKVAEARKPPEKAEDDKAATPAPDSAKASPGAPKSETAPK